MGFFKILQNIFLCVQHKTETFTGLEQHEGEYIFGWTIPLRENQDSYGLPVIIVCF